MSMMGKLRFAQSETSGKLKDFLRSRLGAVIAETADHYLGIDIRRVDEFTFAILSARVYPKIARKISSRFGVSAEYPNEDKTSF
jgi:hypothetical protein